MNTNGIPIIGESLSVQQMADAQKIGYEAAIVSKAELEKIAAEKPYEQFTKGRGIEMKRVVEEIIKPHMRQWAKDWFLAHGLQPPPEDGPTGFAG